MAVSLGQRALCLLGVRAVRLLCQGLHVHVCRRGRKAQPPKPVPMKSDGLRSRRHPPNYTPKPQLLHADHGRRSLETDAIIVPSST
ncbi:hypothetical protein B0T26DRAFT_725845 [Lasiosphaeria miniovina]|uniref:Uncharacterized protein n=1 Tax=Lasiosphaeria miniovina TaxID=1954250 RepID=A0AA39ZYZ5_9PEZI|nr:uncharacterized protein B0T26DRAFT_725845 [Lasiosphaeria miniovina]KAK0706228.1 hypothetical protein B0T26DRAFT_725845 [Lasiosphaeria miniovina]